MKKWVDENRRPLEFKADDQVLVKLKSNVRKYLRGRDKRLVRKYQGPVTIVKKIGKCAYKIDPPSWIKKVSYKQHRQYLVKWKGLVDDEISREREADLTAFSSRKLKHTGQSCQGRQPFKCYLIYL
ncbi:hypothetical protein Vadar_034546 [Vaccinium darrowii]|uniref:Uncharacterized protein n=1 Tax=Vaccinium darrowii TaxID=229202 RepID=A0ACB7ZGE0_9ERIC|nr:hypothetical protein Vadar_034546 [Vaccinium darrowii]